MSLELAPADAELVVVNGVEVDQSYTLIARKRDGSTIDVTEDAAFSVDDVGLGSFSGPTFRTSGFSGGRAPVRGHYDGVETEGTITVRLETDRVDEGAPANAADLFEAAGDDASRAPRIVYPSDGTRLPPNLGDFETHWNPTGGTDLHELTVAGEYSTTRLYTRGAAGPGGLFASLTTEEWSQIGESNRGLAVSLTVRALSTSSPTTAGRSPEITVELTEQDLLGGIYYWASTDPPGVYRHDMSRPGEPAERFYTSAEEPEGRCVGCHVVSRDGTRMALSYDGGGNGEWATVMEIASRTAMIPTRQVNWNFATFAPDADRLVTGFEGVMTLRRVDGSAINTVPVGTNAAQPEFSPDGRALAYIDRGPSSDWNFTGGKIKIIPFDPATDSWGSPRTLWVPDGGRNAFYPSWSPDGRWILFNQASSGGYDAPGAELYVMKADGSGAPIRLDSPNLGAGMTNSWARWAPFSQALGAGTDQEEPFFWLTFSSKRDFGVRLIQSQRPQIWMAPFFPRRAEAGGNPSAPAFRLPFQELSTSNHIAQWTEQVIPVE